MDNKNAQYIFWISDPTVLYKNDKYMEFIPTSEMTRVQQLNSLTRFCVYLLLFFVITGQTDFWIQVPIIIIIFLAIVYFIFEYDKNGKHNELQRMNSDKKEHMSVEKKEKDDFVIESGYYDSNNDLHIEKYKGSHSKNKNNLKYSYEDYNKYEKKTCKRPTANNPFMNDTFDDLQSEDAPKACNINDDDVRDNMKKSFNDGLFRDVGDLFERENSQRQFYTVPQMHPQDQTAFANWLYGNHAICKTNPNYCLRYEDLRYKR